jgi:hypothetical protein
MTTNQPTKATKEGAIIKAKWNKEDDEIVAKYRKAREEGKIKGGVVLISRD